MKKKSETIELRENITRFIAEKLSVYGFKRRKDIFIYRKHNNDILQQFMCSGNIEKIDQLTLEQDAHTSEDGFQSYLLTARREGDSVSRLPMPVFVMGVTMAVAAPVKTVFFMGIPP